MKKYDSEQDGTNGTYAGPHRIGRAYRYGMYGLRQEHHAKRKTCQEACAPQPVLRACGVFHLSQTEGEARFEQAGDNQYEPIHNPAK